MEALGPVATEVLKNWPALLAFAGVFVTAWVLLERVWPGRRKLRQRRHGNGNVIHLHGKRRRRKITMPRIHPLVWLVGVAVLANGYMYLFDKSPDRPGSRQLEGHVTHVRDGDTIEVAGVPVRFARLDCAELGTAAGERAKRQMARLVAGQRLQCALTGRRSYDRMIGECDLMDGRSLSTLMIQEGYCGRWR